MKLGLTYIVLAASIAFSSCVFAHPGNHKDHAKMSTSDKKMLKKAVNGDHRSDKQKARDKYRNPTETLAFFGLKPTMTVVEISPGGGWYSSILAPALKNKGTFYAAHFHIEEGGNEFYAKSRARFEKKIAENPIYSNTKLTSFHPTKNHDIAPAGSADMVVTFRNVHNWYMGGEDAAVEESFKAFFKALKSGGVLGVVEHRLPESRDNSEQKSSGYMKQSNVIKAAEKAGFKLAETSEINANSKDTADHPRGVWTLPPRLALDEENKDKYLAIGESDRMTLKFIKP